MSISYLIKQSINQLINPPISQSIHWFLPACGVVQVVRRRSTEEGEVIPFHQYDVTVGSDDGSEKLFFIWPMTIVHVINQHSPFYNMSAVDLMNER